MSIADIIAEGLEVHQKQLSREEREVRVIKALKDVGLDPDWRFRYPHEFSGGQRQRISIARAVVLEPNFVVLDEPTSALDMLLQAQMVDLLRDLQRKRDLTYMFISHDLRVVASLASHLIVMKSGKVEEEGPASELFKNPKSDYTRALFAASPHLAQGVTAPIPGQVPDPQHRPPGCAFAPRCTRVQPDCTRAVPPLRADVACFHPHPPQ
jgi:microcin C transport system ATP-binding protein